MVGIIVGIHVGDLGLSALSLKPSFTALPAISGTPAVGEVLTATYGTATASEGGGAVSYSGQWFRDGAAISGETGLTYTTPFDAGDYVLAFSSTATDSNGSTTRTASVSIPAYVAPEWAITPLTSSFDIETPTYAAPTAISVSGTSFVIS